MSNTNSLPATSSAIATEWELWSKLLSNGSDTPIDERDLAIEQAVDAFMNGIIEDPAYQSSATVEGTTTPIVASRKSSLECDIKAAPGTDLHIGDLVNCFDENWIVVELYADKVGIINGKMWICNDILRFQNHSTNINTRYCVIDDGSYSRKTSDPVAFVPVNTYKLYASIDAGTKQLYIDKRLAFGKVYSADGSQVLEVYKIIGMDLKSKNFGDGSHLMVLTLQRDVYNDATDDFANMICDTFAPSPDVPTPSVSGSCLIVGRDAIRIGTTRKYTARFTDASGATVVATPTWSVVAPTGVSTTVENGVMAVEVPMKDSLIGSEVTLTLTDSGNVYGTYKKKVQVITVG